MKKLITMICICISLLPQLVLAAEEDYGLKNLKLKPIKIEELFYNKHAGTKYNPIKLEAALYQPQKLNLAEIIAQAIENNLNLNIAKQDSKIAKWKYWAKIADGLPDIQLNSQSVNRDGTFYLNSNFQNEIDEDIVTASFRVNYRIFNGGTTAFLAWAERYYRESTELNEKEQYNRTLLESVRLYYELVQAQTALSSKLKALESAKLDLELAEKFLKAGTGTKFDSIQAEARLARAQQQLITQEADFRIAQINLAQHLNAPLLTPFTVDTKNIQELKLIDQKLEMNDFISVAFKNNPAILSALKSREGAKKEGYAKIGDFLPSLDVFTDITGSGGEYGELFGITTVGFNANYSIGEGLGLSPTSDLMESKAKVKKAELLYQQELQRIEKDLRFSYIEFQKSKSLVNASQKELAAAKEALRLARLRYENGLEIFTDLIKKETELTEAEINLIKSSTAYNLAQAQISYDMGTISLESIIKQ